MKRTDEWGALVGAGRRMGNGSEMDRWVRGDGCRPAGWRAWVLAARPRTLAGAVAPVAVAVAAAWVYGLRYGGELNWLVAGLCGAFAVLMQVDANLINDYLDGVSGRDSSEERLGPRRAVAEGWIEPRAMLRGIVVVTVMAGLTGLPLAWTGGWGMVAIGAVCMVAAFLYTAAIAGRGLGDVMVVVFFGLVPVMTTFWLLTGAMVWMVVALALGMGVATDGLLLVNNYRDVELDARAGKRTLVVMVGKGVAEWLFVGCGVVAVVVPVVTGIMTDWLRWGKWSWVGVAMVVVYLGFHVASWRRLKAIGSGRELNMVLGRAAAGILLYAAAMVVMIVVGR